MVGQAACITRTSKPGQKTDFWDGHYLYYFDDDRDSVGFSSHHI